MSRYIDAEWLTKTLTSRGNVLIDSLDSAPSIDIVRCGECKKRDDDYVCYKWASVDECPQVRPDDFCSYGEREGE